MRQKPVASVTQTNAEIPRRAPTRGLLVVEAAGLQADLEVVGYPVLDLQRNARGASGCGAVRSHEGADLDFAAILGEGEVADEGFLNELRGLRVLRGGDSGRDEKCAEERCCEGASRWESCWGHDDAFLGVAGTTNTE